MGKCKDVAHLLSDALDRSLAISERLAVLRHLPTCSGCRNYRAQIALMRRTAREWADGVDSAEQRE